MSKKTFDTDQSLETSLASEASGDQTLELNLDGTARRTCKSGLDNFPGITVNQLDELLEERQSGDRRKSTKDYDFADRRIGERRNKDKSATT